MLQLSRVLIGFSLLAFSASTLNAAPAAAPDSSGDGLLVRPVRGLIAKGDSFVQPIEIILQKPAGAATAELQVVGSDPQQVKIDAGVQTTQVLVPAVDADTKVDVTVTVGNDKLTGSATIHPVRKLTIYVLPHSHHDLGYTALQPDVEKEQVDYLRRGIELARKTADFPEGARFVWNEEVLWGTDQYVRRLPQADRDKLIDACKKGWVSLNAMYGNTLTALCRPEELLQLFDESTRLSDLTGVKIDCAMQSDVPGVTWGLATALGQCGIRYFSLAPNFRSRVGDIIVQWEDKPFWWVSPSGKDRILVWVPRNGYAIPVVIPNLDNRWVGTYQQDLDDSHYPYDISYIRYALDNYAPDENLPSFVKQWNTKYAWPKFMISSTKTAFAEMEKRYGDKLPEFKGDMTPYWEDGAASSALETAINRNAADRVVQAETLFSMLAPDHFPLDADREAWRNVLLYSEHTWGAAGSVSDAESPMTTGQWKYKQAYAVDADKQSRELLDKAVAVRTGETATGSVDVFNTTSWTRTELVLASKELSAAGDHVTDSSGKAVPSQRLSTGELAILAQDVPPFSTVRYTIAAGEATAPGEPVHAEAESIANALLSARVNTKTGGIDELKRQGSDQNYVATADGEALNDYVYMIGNNARDAKGSESPKITVVENGPLVASLRIESSAAGTNKLTRELRLVAGDDHIDLTNIIDKKRVASRAGKDGKVSYGASRSKESLNFSFPFNVDAGQIRLNLPFSIVRPEIDQIPGSCKDWMEVGRWADVSNDKEGVTLATLDVPLVEIGKLSTILGMANDLKIWRKTIEPTQKIYSWVMNNHWYTNYRAYQDGIITVRYALRPHAEYDATTADHFGIAETQPLIVAAAAGPAPTGKPFLTVEPADILVTALKPSSDGKALILRLFGTSDKETQAKITFGSGAPKSISISDITEKPITKAGDTIAVPAAGLVTLRIEK